MITLLIFSLQLSLESINVLQGGIIFGYALEGRVKRSMKLVGKKGNEQGLVSRIKSTLYLIMYVLCILSFDVSVVTPLNNSSLYSELSRLRGLTTNVSAE